jgi:hypothetical protein
MAERFSMSIADDRVVLQARLETCDTIGDFIMDIYPDTPLTGKVTYQQLRELGSGIIEVDDDWNSVKLIPYEEDEDDY